MKYFRVYYIYFLLVVMILVGIFGMLHDHIPRAHPYKAITVSEEGSLPEVFNLDVPFSSQAPDGDWSEPWQNACEEVTLLMLEAYYSGEDLSTSAVKERIIQMVEWEGAEGWFTSIGASDILALANEFITPPGGYTLQIIQNPSVEDIKRFIAAGHPVFAVADGKALENPHFTDGGPVYHTLIIKGYTEDDFITNDPGTRHGEDFRYEQDHLLTTLHDWNGGDVPNGTPSILVLTKTQ